MIIDSHLHFPVLKSRNFKQAKGRLLKDLKKNRIGYAVVIPDNLHSSVIPDLDTSLELLKNEKKLFLMGTLDILRDKKPLTEKLDSLFKAKKIVAIKIFPGHDPHYPTDKRLIPAIKLCMKYDLPFVIHTGWNTNHPEVAKYNDPKHIVKIAKRYPKLKIIIAHYFWPEVEYCYEITRGYSNIYFDTSGLADEEVIRETGLRKIREVLKRTITDNPESVVFGTDYGICTFESHIDLIDSLKISEEEKQSVFYKNAIKLFKLKPEWRRK
jgi:predicted TIM-barrel fold metal-dependent hydrolase